MQLLVDSRPEWEPDVASLLASGAYERFVRLVKRTLEVPVALLTIVHEDRQEFAEQLGLAEPWAGEGCTPLELSYCRFVQESGAGLFLEDTRADARFADHPANDALDVAAYAGLPVRNRFGRTVAVLCAIDERPRPWPDDDREALTDVRDALEAQLRADVQGLIMAAQLRRAETAREFEQALGAAAELSNRARSVDAAASALIRTGAPVVGASFASLAMVENGTVTFHFGPDPSEELSKRWPTASLLDPIPVTEAIRTGRTVVLASPDDFAAWPPVESDLVGLGLEAFVAVPIHDPLSGWIGALGLGFDHPLPDGALPAGTDRLVSLVSGVLYRVAAQEYERRQARMLASVVIPHRLSSSRELDLASSYWPPTTVQRVGGDCFDVIERDDDQTIVVMADVVGHDLEATRTAVRVRHALGAYGVERPRSAGELLAVTNRYVRQPGRLRLVTCSLAIIDHAAGTLCVASAGHPQPLLRRASGAIEAIGPVGEPLLGATDHDYSETEVPFAPGDTLTFYTDGVIERRDAPDFDGVGWLSDLVAENEAAHDVVDAVGAALADLERSDDAAVLVVRRPPLVHWAPDLVLGLRAGSLRLGEIRRACSDWLARSGSSALEPSIELVVTELVTNARNATTAIDDEVRIRLAGRGTVATVEVSNPGGDFEPSPEMPPASSVRGRGLPIVEALSDEVDIVDADGWVTVRAVVSD